MYNPKRYSVRTNNVFEKIGSYFVGIFYNNLYDTAKQEHVAGRASSITDAYNTVCVKYVRHFGDPDLYRQTTQNLHKYFESFGQTSLPYAEYVDTIAQEFIPEDYWDGIPIQKRDWVMGHVLQESAKAYVKWILTPMGLKMMIDERGIKGNIPILQNRMVEILFEKRLEMFTNFMNKAIGSSNTVDSTVREESKKLTAENNRLREHIKKIVAMAKGMQQKISYLTSRAQRDEIQKADLQRKIDELTLQIRAPAPTPAPAATPTQTQAPLPTATPTPIAVTVQSATSDIARAARARRATRKAAPVEPAPQPITVDPPAATSSPFVVQNPPANESSIDDLIKTIDSTDDTNFDL